MEEGSSGKLQSTYPPLTAPAWASFMTGKSPGDHGVFDFFCRDQKSYSQNLNSIQNIKDKKLWDILNHNGKTTGLINLPLSYPTPKVDGFFISGLLTPHGAKDFIFQPGLLKELKNNIGPYLLHHEHTGDPDEVLDEAFTILKYRTKTAIYLYDKYPTDFFMVHYFGTDRIQHEFWHLLDPSHPLFNHQMHLKYKDRILQYFRSLDNNLKMLSDHTGKDTVFMIISDHGFGPIHKFMNVNQWLIKENFMFFKRNLFTSVKRLLFGLGFTYSNMAKFILKFGLSKKAIQAGRAKRQKLQEKIFLSLKDIDWSRTVAYSMGNFGQIFLNLKGREPQGIILESEYDETVKKIISKLRRFRDPDTGKECIDRIFLREELFKGKYKNLAPDIFFLTKKMEIKPNGLSDFTSHAILEPAFASTGHHRLDGIFIAYHPDIINKKHDIKNLKIIDIAPTILYLMNSAVLPDMDGRVLLEIFNKDYIKKNPVQYSKVKKINKKESKSRVYSPLEEKKIKDQLKKLGYI